jgi:hypothetical protein
MTDAGKGRIGRTALCLSLADVRRTERQGQVSCFFLIIHLRKTSSRQLQGLESVAVRPCVNLIIYSL